MIRQNIDALKLLRELHSINRENPDNPRYSILDGLALLLINEHPQSCKSDLSEMIYGTRQASKSAFDKPINRLAAAGLVAAEHNKNASTKNGAGRVLYSVSKSGERFLRKTQIERDTKK